MNLDFDIDERFMFRAIELARLGMGNVSPNPMVGSVIVLNGKIIGEGYHRQFGGPHAEVNAIESVNDKRLLRQSTIYVTLEPCSHHGKTPPCADLIVAHQIPNVVIGTADPFAAVAGRGIRRLKEAGCRVFTGLLEPECANLNRRFFTFHNQKRPFIILKWAQTTDGFIDIERTAENYGQPTWITNDLSRMAVHKMRTDEAAIIVGTNTAMKDNPSLTVREWCGSHPLRLVIDRQLRLPKSLKLFDCSTPTVVYTSKVADTALNLEYVTLDFDGSEIEQILNDLYQRGIISLIVEGGRTLLNSFLSRSLWDEARVFTGNKKFFKGIEAPTIPSEPFKYEELDNSSVSIYRR